MRFHERLAALRQARNLSQEALAERMEVARQSVARWETGKAQPDMEKLIRLADFFGVSLDQLARESDYRYLQAGTGLPAQDALIAFLLVAKRNTYAAGDGKMVSSRPGSNDFAYSCGDDLYIDSYLGGEAFAGTEAVWHRNAPVWCMNYAGAVTGDGFSGDFLKAALMAVSPEMPYRGPSLFRSGEYVYHCRVDGSFDRFKGREAIFLSDVEVYTCVFHGGSIRP